MSKVQPSEYIATNEGAELNQQIKVPGCGPAALVDSYYHKAVRMVTRLTNSVPYNNLINVMLSTRLCVHACEHVCVCALVQLCGN